MRVLVTGANGQLGCEIKRELQKSCNLYFFVGHDSLDITNEDEVNNFINKNNIDVIINCAAYTKFDLCKNNYNDAYMINTIGPRILANSIKKNNGILIHISSDYVFSGDDKKEYETNDKTYPISVYGKSKSYGEKLIIDSECNYLIFRTSWLYGGEKKNFVDTIFKAIGEKNEIKVVNDQFGTPTYVNDLSKFLVGILEKYSKQNLIKKTGIYHFSNTGITSWYDIAKTVYEYRKELDGNYKTECKIVPISTNEYPSTDKRPKYSPLSSKDLLLFGYRSRNWKLALKDCILRYINDKK